MIPSKVIPKLKPIIDESIYNKYFAGENGRIYEEVGNSYRLVSGVWKDKDGYLRVPLYGTLNGREVRQPWLVDHLIAVAWLSNCPENVKVRHKNGNQTDNRPENLEWKTISEKGYIKRLTSWIDSKVS